MMIVLNYYILTLFTWLTIETVHYELNREPDMPNNFAVWLITVFPILVQNIVLLMSR